MNALTALSFSSPLLLAALGALPLVWLLLRATPPTPNRVNFPAFIILRQLNTKEETPDKTPWWLLLMRLLIAALIIVGLAGPVLNAPAVSTNTGPIVFIIDDTWAAAANWTKRQDALEQKSAESATTDRPIIVLTTTPAQTPAPINVLSPGQLNDVVGGLEPKPFRANRMALVNRFPALDDTLARLDGDPEFIWLSDGLSNEDDNVFAASLRDRGTLTVLSDPISDMVVIRQNATQSSEDTFQVDRMHAETPWNTTAIASARDGRELTRSLIASDTNTKTLSFNIDLPLALRNEVSLVRLEGVSSAAAVQLIDARERRALVGLVKSEGGQANNLLTGNFYLQKALEPFASFSTATLSDLLASDVSVIMLDDIGRLREGDEAALQSWIENGGVVVRFAGPNLADATQDGAIALLPVALRGGGRAFGGALSWDTPQKMGVFGPESPFSDLTIPTDVLIRRQVLAAPGGATSMATWASLEDGTPLVTGKRLGDGALALFHVTATPAWSDLPISSTFVDMLRKLIFLSVLSPESIDAAETARFAPIKVLDGFGRFQDPAPELTGITASQAAQGPAPSQPPGYYGALDAPIAINTVSASEDILPLALNDITLSPYGATPPTPVAPALFVIALVLFLADMIASLAISGKLRFSAALLLAAFFLPMSPADAQTINTPINDKAAAAALSTRLAYVKTGDPQVDRISNRGLIALSEELIRRTAIEPSLPVGVNPETDDLSVYPFLYWPIAAGASAPSEAALANIENFMRFGGLIVFDTRDDERAIAGLETPERNALRAILSQLDIPPLTPIPDEHVLRRSYYLLTDLAGRTSNNPVWVQAVGGLNDSVTPVIIGGRDWAGAWATDDLGQPLLPVGRAGARVLKCAPRSNVRVRECALRAGINMVMVAFTGNYKSDQVHTPVLLERLGQ